MTFNCQTKVIPMLYTYTKFIHLCHRATAPCSTMYYFNCGSMLCSFYDQRNVTTYYDTIMGGKIIADSFKQNKCIAMWSTYCRASVWTIKVHVNACEHDSTRFNARSISSRPFPEPLHCHYVLQND